MHRRLIFMTILLVSFVPIESDAFRIELFRKLAQGNNSTADLKQPSPSPSPVQSVDPSSVVDNSSQAPACSPKPEPFVPVSNKTCEMVSNRCRDQKYMTACLPPARSGSKGSFLLVQNDGESSISVNATIFPFNKTYKEIEIPKNEVHEIDISANVAGSSSILLNAGNGDCVIYTRASVPQGYFYDKFPSYAAAYVTPINGAYLLFVTAVVIGGVWTCCRLGKRGRGLDGVPYQELEMEQPEALSSTNVVTAEGWDQDWEDDWDEEKAVKPSGGNHVGNGLANGHNSRSSDIDGWGNDWDD